jgi:hypothetical protein
MSADDEVKYKEAIIETLMMASLHCFYMVLS